MLLELMDVINTYDFGHICRNWQSKKRIHAKDSKILVDSKGTICINHGWFKKKREREESQEW